MKKLVAFLLTLLLAMPVMAQEEEAPADDFMKSTQQDILTVAGAGAAGAILGLSTLSFSDKPSNHIANIWTGAAVGVIIGVIFVAYNSAQKGTEDLSSSVDFKTHDRLAWHDQNTSNLSPKPVQFGTQIWQTNF